MKHTPGQCSICGFYDCNCKAKIAVFQDLLEACKILVSWAKGNNLIGMTNEPPGIDEAMRAIAKAEGK